MTVVGRAAPQGKDCQEDLQSEIDSALEFLRSGGVIAFATDTLYGLGADGFSQPALEKIFAIKGRPEGQPLPVLVSSWEQVAMVAGDSSPVAESLAGRFWPGALTLVLMGLPQLPRLVTGGGDTVAVRMPNHPVPLALAEGLGRPITGTSANRSGRPDIKNLGSLTAELGNEVDSVVKAGPSPTGIASTIVDLTAGELTLIREGAIPFQSILET